MEKIDFLVENFMFLRSIKRSLVDFIKTYRLKKFYSLSNKLIEPE